MCAVTISNDVYIRMIRHACSTAGIHVVRLAYGMLYGWHTAWRACSTVSIRHEVRPAYGMKYGRHTTCSTAGIRNVVRLAYGMKYDRSAQRWGSGIYYNWYEWQTCTCGRGLIDVSSPYQGWRLLPLTSPSAACFRACLGTNLVQNIPPPPPPPPPMDMSESNGDIRGISFYVTTVSRPSFIQLREYSSSA